MKYCRVVFPQEIGEHLLQGLDKLDYESSQALELQTVQKCDHLATSEEHLSI